MRGGGSVSEKTDKGALHNPIVRFHGPCLIIFLQRVNFLLPRDLKPNSSIWSGRVRSILCWFYGWEDENYCQEEKEEHKGEERAGREKLSTERRHKWWGWKKVNKMGSWQLTSIHFKTFRHLYTTITFYSRLRINQQLLPCYVSVISYYYVTSWCILV